MAKECQLAYLSYLTIEAESKAEAQRKLVDHLDECPNSVYRLFGRFIPLEEAFFLFHKIDGASDEESREFVAQI